MYRHEVDGVPCLKVQLAAAQARVKELEACSRHLVEKYEARLREYERRRRKMLNGRTDSSHVYYLDGGISEVGGIIHDLSTPPTEASE